MKKQRVLAVCSGGGHWIQMKRLAPAFDGFDLTYATVTCSDQDRLLPARVLRIPDANRDTKFKLILLTLRLTWIVARYRPTVVISTGAAPGYLAVRLGRLVGAKTLFMDSIANAEELSLSAKMVIPYADVTLSQWTSVADSKGISYWGAVL